MRCCRRYSRAIHHALPKHSVARLWQSAQHDAGTVRVRKGGIMAMRIVRVFLGPRGYWYVAFDDNGQVHLFATRPEAERFANYWASGHPEKQLRVEESERGEASRAGR